MPRLFRGVWLLRRLVTELSGLREACERIAQALETDYAQRRSARYLAEAPIAHTDPEYGMPPVEVHTVDDQQQEELMQIELSLTRARGSLPSEEDIVAEFERRHGDGSLGGF